MSAPYMQSAWSAIVRTVWTLSSCIAALTFVLPQLAHGQVPRSVAQQLQEQGVVLADGQFQKLPQPVLPDGLDAAAQRQALEQISAPRLSLQQLLRDSIVAPHILQMTSADQLSSQGGRFQQIDLYFVAYGDLDAAAEEDYLREHLVEAEGAAEDEVLASKVVVLDAVELQQRMLDVPSRADRELAFAYVLFPVLGRVQLAVTLHTELLRTEESLTFAALVDPRFAGDATYPNRWRSIERDPLGPLSRGAPRPYSGAGGYMKITKLHEPAQALLVECHIGFDEPHGWFNGVNLLRSKLPLAIQGRIRAFRRELAASLEKR